LGQYERAIDHHTLSREIGDRDGEGKSLANLGITYHSLGQYDHAIDNHKKALAIHRDIGDRRSEGEDLGSLGTKAWVSTNVRSPDLINKKVIKKNPMRDVPSQDFGDTKSAPHEVLQRVLGGCSVYFHNNSKQQTVLAAERDKLAAKTVPKPKPACYARVSKPRFTRMPSPLVVR
jgi:tetratricopeptide (TPR) repeat protein